MTTQRGQTKVELEEAKQRLCQALGITPSMGDDFFAIVKQQIEKVGLNFSQCSDSIRLGIGVECSPNQLRGSGSYSRDIFKTTLDGLIKVLQTAAKMPQAEKTDIKAQYNNRPKNLRLLPKTLASKYANAIIEKLQAERGVNTEIHQGGRQ